MLRGFRRRRGRPGGGVDLEVGPARPDPEAPFAVLSAPPPAPAHVPRPFYVGHRGRIATCGGAAWFHGLRLATVHLWGDVLRTYAFDPTTRRFAPLQTLGRRSGIVRPENLAFSGDGTLLAVTNSVDARVNVFAVDRRTHAVARRPSATIECGRPVNPHGVAISPGGRLAFTTVEDPGGIRPFALVGGARGRLRAEPLPRSPNRLSPLKPKAIAFAPGGRFAAVCYGPNANPAPGPADPGHVAVLPFDEAAGLFGEPVSVRGSEAGLACPEDLAFLPDGSGLVVVDHATDAAAVLDFDAASGALGRVRRRWTGPAARVSFPHGVSVSADGRFLAVANYGDDSVVVHDLGA